MCYRKRRGDSQEERCNLRKLFAVLVFVGLASNAAAQVLVINPTKAEFNASADHNLTENEIALVSSYELRVFVTCATVPLRVLNLAKPTPDANNLIIVDIVSLVRSLPVGDYFATVAVKGPGGESISTPSNPFQVTVRAPVAPTNLRVTK